MKYLYTLLPAILASCQLLSAQQQTPHVSGGIKISMRQGLIQCNLTLTDLPDLGTQYKLLLYRGLNIGLLRNDTGRVIRYIGYYDNKLQGEAAAYVPIVNNDTLKLPRELKISYTGAFPIFTDTLNAFDSKGLIAFNGQTVRAAEQSKWYPVIYDVKKEKELLDVTYDVTIECTDCKTIYINGSTPKAGPIANFKSDKARELLLFAGNYNIQNLSESNFLNSDLTNSEANIFNNNIVSIKTFYEQYLNRPYREKITFLQHKAIEPFNSKRSWGFVTFPTIAVAGKTFKSQVDLETGLFKDTSNYHFYAHEMGHYYFGQLLQPNSTLRWFFLETTTEFLSIKATEAKYGKIATQKYIAEKKGFMNDWKVKPLSQITDPESVGEGYRYDYAPLILLAMEKRFGQEDVRKFLQLCLDSTRQFTDYNFLLEMIRQAGIKKNDWKLFEDQIINQSDCINIFKYL